MNQEERQQLFDTWAASYEQDLAADQEGYPFAGYNRVLATVCRAADCHPGQEVLDLGIGTGNLAARLVTAGCRVWGVDFSAEMLKLAGRKLPQVDLIQLDLTVAEWPDALQRRFDRIVSTYAIHEMTLADKVTLLNRLGREHLAAGGKIVIGDLSWPTAAARDAFLASQDDWEDDEFYWAADETRAALKPAGWQIGYQQISFCAGVYTFQYR
jgi:putative AdoMet-dependent methyltransferase